MKKIDVKRIIVCSAKTFAQAAIPVFIAAVSSIDISQEKPAVKALLISAVVSAAIAGLSAVWNIASQMMNRKNQCKGEADTKPK